MARGKKQQIIFKGKGCSLGLLTSEHVPFLVKWSNDQEIAALTHTWLPPHWPENWQKYVSNLPESTTEMMFTVLVADGRTKKHQKVIGVVDLTSITFGKQRAEFGIVIGEKKYWGKGHGLEATRLMLGYAFDQLGLWWIDSSTLTLNTASIRLHERTGFHKIGVKEGWVFHDGEYVSHTFFGHRRDWWQKKK